MATELAKVVGGKTVRARESDYYVNATELCKAAGKKWNNYQRNEGTQDFLKSLESETRIRVSDLVQVTKGGSGEQGTWIHPRVVIHFAQWASAEFAVAVTGWVLELMTTGKVELNREDPTYARMIATVRAEVVAEFTPIISELRAMIAKPPPEPFTTIPDRCEYWGWQEVDEKLQRKIRDLAYNLCWQACGERPVISLRHSIWVGAQIPFLDDAIASVRRRHDGLEQRKKKQPSIPGMSAGE